MSESFSTVLIKDDRLNCKSSVKYAVEKGGASVTYSEIRAVSASNSSHVYNVIVPSEQTIVDRRVEWSSEIRFRVRFNNLPAGNDKAGGLPPYDLLGYGLESALCAYPLHSCTTVVSATINNNTVTQNMDDVLQTLIRFMDRRLIHKYTGVTPTMPDNYLNYADGKNAQNNPLGSYNNAEKVSDYHARGSYQLLGVNLTGYDTVANNTVYSGAGGSQDVFVRFKTTEPFMMSPFIYSHDKVNSQGFYGIQNMNFKFNIDPHARIWRQSKGLNTNNADGDLVPTPTVQIDSFENSKLTFCFLTPHPEDMLPSKNVVSFLECPRFITQGGSTVPALGTVTQDTQTIQLNQCPDKLLVAVRRKNLGCGDSDSFMPITAVSINWNNSSGILASANQEKLWLMSVESGINQSWLEWSGQAHDYNASVSNGTPVNPYPALTVPLVGGILALNFGTDIEIRESYYAPGSLGTFQLQMKISFFNQDPSNAVSPNNYEIVVMPLNSGVFVLERGTCSTYTGILTKQDVLDTSSKQPYYRSDVERLVGAGLMDNLKSTIGSAMAKESGQSGDGMSGGKNRRTA